MLPHFSFSFDGTIWQVLPDTEQNYLIVEVRHPNHLVSFAAIDVAKQKLLWDNFLPPDTWWSSGVLAHRGILFLQTFPEGQNPDPNGIIAIQISSRQILWQQSDLQFVQILEGNRLLARTFAAAESRYYVLDGNTGSILYTDTGLAPSAAIASTPQRLRFPVQYRPDDTHYKMIETFMQHFLKISPKNAIDYAETEHCIIISYYIYANNQVENYLVLFDTHSRVPLLHEKIATQRTGIGKDTFFIFDQYLLFVKEQSSLLSYEI